MKNFAYDNNPKQWVDYYGHPHAVDIAKKFLTEEPYQSIFVTGESGVGKTAWVLLLIKAAKCLNRPKDSMEPCGKCAACLSGDPRQSDPTLTDVWWIQPGADAEVTLNKSVKDAMIAAQKGHKHSGDGADIMFVVFDEFQRFGSQLRQPLLHNAEVRADSMKVVYIFITMQEEMMDATEQIAFQRRGAYLKLRPFNEAEVYDYLINKYPDCPAETAALIAKNSQQSIGLAVSYYFSIKEYDPDLDPAAAAAIIGCANNNQRSKLWGLLYEGARIAEVKNYLANITRISSARKVAQQLIDDVINTADLIGGPTDEQSLAVRLLNQYLANYTNTDLISYLLQLKKLPVVSKEGIELQPDYSLNYAVDQT